MSSLEVLIPYIYHEKQQQGSMLCAQHALNSLLQGNYFTPPDLSDIARTLDAMEESYDDSNTGESSMNMDDTGFFSVQVLENALKVWGLNLTRWRGESMRPYHDHPQTQLAFILNLEQHWFTLRRFGDANANIDLDDGNGHWFNLNSFLPFPEWVGKLYLGMVLQQAETEGYSVFAVTQADVEAPLALPRTEGDIIASTLPEPASAAGLRAEAHLTRGRTRRDLEAGGVTIEDDDYELQAALQASLTGRIAPSGRTRQTAENTVGLSSGYVSELRSPLFGESSRPDTPGHVDEDPVAASMEKNRVLLQRMKEQQEFAQREMWSESDLSPEEQAALEVRREHRRKQEEEEEAQLRRAIEESQTFATLSEKQRPGRGFEDPQINVESSSAVYDDGDAELQAALKASLQHFPSSSTQPQPVRSDETDSVVSDTASANEEPEDVVSPIPSLEEIRQRRLARFGV
ncbi:Josephin-domain-containing protein [Gymnopilus junonius]|uniref:ubiquitinyl hydrolase 1 n=1 Tax=Gymnopilus junonius TaxID=109634 RepID=A0A9P5NTV6_GYMJU|nr:Josephin-domain-containing protein [Gymnopilus junonius]